MRLIMMFVVFFVVSGLSFSTTIIVPVDYLIIQDAIDVSANGDTIIVKPGTYVENIDFKGKAITVKSEKGANVTTIDGMDFVNPDFRCVVNFSNGEGPDSVLEGFTITNGNDAEGGGIRCLGSSPTISGNYICNNAAGVSGGFGDSPGRGGGIYCSDSSPTIINNIIADNVSRNGFIEFPYPTPIPGYGGGIFCYKSSPKISNNVIDGNEVFGFGGGIYCCESSPILTAIFHTLQSRHIAQADLV